MHKIMAKMKLYDVSIIIIGFLIIVAGLGYVSSRYLGDDNPIEELAEEIIERQTGLDIDLTFNSPEDQI